MVKIYRKSSVLHENDVFFGDDGDDLFATAVFTGDLDFVALDAQHGVGNLFGVTRVTAALVIVFGFEITAITVLAENLGNGVGERFECDDATDGDGLLLEGLDLGLGVTNGSFEDSDLSCVLHDASSVAEIYRKSTTIFDGTASDGGHEFLGDGLDIERLFTVQQ